MRIAGNLDQYNDDDFFSGGPCPSCRLAINKETGRLKWCMGGNDTWRFRVKLMLLVPAVLLPMTIIFIALSRSQEISKTPYNDTYLIHAIGKQDENTSETFPSTSRSETKQVGKEGEEDTIPMLTMRSSDVSEKIISATRRTQRYKRHLDRETRASSSSETLKAMSFRILYPKSAGNRIQSWRIENDLLKSVVGNKDRELDEREEIREHSLDYNLGKEDERNSENIDNFLFDYYPQGNSDEIKKNSEIQNDDYREYDEHAYGTLKNEDLRSKFFHGRYDNIDKCSWNESDEGEQGGKQPVSIVDVDANLPITDMQHDDEFDTNFHVFWKKGGNPWTTRETQEPDIRHSKNHAQVHGQEH